MKPLAESIGTFVFAVAGDSLHASHKQRSHGKQKSKDLLSHGAQEHFFDAASTGFLICNDNPATSKRELPNVCSWRS